MISYQVPGVPSWGALFTNNNNVMKTYPFRVIEWDDCEILNEFKDYTKDKRHVTFCAVCTYDKWLCGIELGDALVMITDEKYYEFFLYGLSYKMHAAQMRVGICMYIHKNDIEQ